MINRALSRLLLAIACAAVGGVLAASVFRAVLPPQLQLDAPAQGAVVAQPTIELAGRAPGAWRVRLNGIELPISGKDGMFRETVPLAPGVNLLQVVAKKRHSGERRVERRVIYRAP